MEVSAASFGKPTGCFKKFTSCRWVLAIMLCLLRMCQTALRQSIGMALVCMAERPPQGSAGTISQSGANNSQHTKTDIVNKIYSVGLGMGNHTVDEINPLALLNGTRVNFHPDGYFPVDANASAQLCNTGEREFQWDASFEGIVLSSYYYGYLLTPLLSSYLERVFGAKTLVTACIGVGAVVNLVTPELTRLHKYLLVALRIVAGTTNGMIDPAVQSLWAVWAPKSEIAYLTAVEYAGVSMGGIFTFLVSGLLCQVPLDNGWPLVFYFYGAMSILWLGLWLTLIYDKPDHHPRISAEELKYILSETAAYRTKKEKIHPPWMKILSSPAVWAIVIASATFMWVYSWVLCYLPMYMQDVLRFNIAENATLSSLPFLGKFISGLICGYISDRLLRTRMSITFNRKMFQMIGCLGCACCTLAISFLDYDTRKLAVALLILAVTLQNITTVAYRINPLDIAPRYAGFILALANTIAVGVSLTAPLVTSAVISDKTQEEWQIMFYVVAGLSVIGGIAFVFLGKANLQDWAKALEEESDGTFDTDGNSNCTRKDSLSVFIYSDGNKKGYLYNSYPDTVVKDDSNTGFLCDLYPSDSHLENGMDSSLTTKRQMHESESPLRTRRQDHGSLANVVQELDAASQWSSCLSLTG